MIHPSPHEAAVADRRAATVKSLGEDVVSYLEAIELSETVSGPCPDGCFEHWVYSPGTDYFQWEPFDRASLLVDIAAAILVRFWMPEVVHKVPGPIILKRIASGPLIEAELAAIQEAWDKHFETQNRGRIRDHAKEEV